MNRSKERREYSSKEKSSYGDDQRQSKTYPSRHNTSKSYPDKSKRGKHVSSFRRARNIKPRKFLARLVTASSEDEPYLSRSYLAELLETGEDNVEYWEDSLCCSADAKTLVEDYDTREDEVTLPNAYDPMETESEQSYHHQYEGSYVNHNPYGMIIGYDDYDDMGYDESYYTSYNVTSKETASATNPLHVYKKLNLPTGTQPLKSYRDPSPSSKSSSRTSSRAFELEDQYASSTIANKPKPRRISATRVHESVVGGRDWYNEYEFPSTRTSRLPSSTVQSTYRTPVTTATEMRKVIAERQQERSQRPLVPGFKKEVEWQMTEKQQREHEEYVASQGHSLSRR
jgi:hypothetical protein